MAINARDAVLRANQKTTWRRLYFLGVAAVFGLAAKRNDESDSAAYKDAYQREEKVEASLVRCIFGNPFQATANLSRLMAWNDALVVRIAQAAYEERELPSGQLTPQRLAVLADALEEAGADTDMMEHLRGPSLHYRGCHVVDRILGKE